MATGMKTPLACLVSSLVFGTFATDSRLEAADAALPHEFSGATPIQWSVRAADSEMARRGDKLAWRPGGNAKWDYAAGLFTLSLIKLSERVNDSHYAKYAESVIGSFIGQGGTIQEYNPEEYNLDNLNPGKTVLALYRVTTEERYRKAAELLRKQLETQPRTPEGGFWHKQKYPQQMWLDGLYMEAPFYAECAKLFQEPDRSFDDIAMQIRLVDEHTYNPATGLFYHGWDESKTQAWANKITGTSSNFWGRAIGWYGMALVDVLDFFPANHPARPEIIATLQKLCAGVVKHQDAASGLWYQVVDEGGREGNYLEATASSMFVYTLAKGVNRGYLTRDFAPAALKGYQGLIEKLIKVDSKGGTALTHCCSVAGLGYDRDGSYDYYIKEPVVENDLKGIGPFVLAGIEVQELLGLPINPWQEEEKILAQINAPKFPAREFTITRFGAVGDGATDSCKAIGEAIAACVKSGGGRVVVPKGEFLTGPIHLQSNVELHLDAGATLKFTTNTQAYLPAVMTRFEGMECYNYSPLIYAFEAHDIAVTGEGVLDGQASEESWWQYKGGRGTAAHNQKAARERLAKLADDGAPVGERRFGEGDFLRPSFIETYRCRNVLISGVRIRRSPMWELHPTLSTNVIVHGVDILSHGPNNDGCDPECCRNVLIEDCVFDTGDDCIAIKSGRNNDGRRVGLPSENLVIRRCTMKDGHGGVVVGSEISGGCRNVFAEDCRMDSPNLERVLRLKSNAVRGGVLENIFMRNVTVGQVKDAVLQIDLLYEEGANGPYKPVIRNVVMENFTVNHTPRVLNVAGFPAAQISGVRIWHCTFKDVQKPDALKDAGDVKVEECVVDKAN
jgi:unsaturated rhamnogalacturonyl hydrolase